MKKHHNQQLHAKKYHAKNITKHKTFLILRIAVTKIMIRLGNMNGMTHHVYAQSENISDVKCYSYHDFISFRSE